MRARLLSFFVCALLGAGAWAGDAVEVIPARYACDNGEKIDVRFFPQKSLAVLVRNKRSLELPQQVSGSGFIYSNGRPTVLGKGDDLTLDIGRRAPISCRTR